jgi:hypothetical protein
MVFSRLTFSCFLYLDVSGRLSLKYALRSELVGERWYYCRSWKGSPAGDSGDSWNEWDGQTGIITKEVSVGQEIPIRSGRKGAVIRSVVTAIRKSNLRGWYIVTIVTKHGKRWIMVAGEYVIATTIAN